MQNPNPQDQPVSSDINSENQNATSGTQNVTSEQSQPVTEEKNVQNKPTEKPIETNNDVKKEENTISPKAVPPEQTMQNQASQMAEQGAEKMQEMGKEGVQKVGNVVQGVLSPKGPDENQPPVRQDEKNYAAIGYVPFVALISIIVKPDSAYVRMHAKQALLLAIMFFFGGILAAIVSLFGIIGQLLAVVMGLIPLASLVLAGYSMYLAYMGFWWKIPVLSTVANIIPVEMMAKVSKENITGQAGVAKEDYDVRQEALTEEKKEAVAPQPTVEVKNETVAPVKNEVQQNVATSEDQTQVQTEQPAANKTDAAKEQEK